MQADQSIVLVVVIAGVAIALALASFLYSSYNSDLIAKSAIKDIQRTARIQTNDINKILLNKVEDVRDNLVVMSQSNRVQAQDVQATGALFATAQDTTKEFTDSYFWVGADGKLLWANSFTDQATYQQFAGADRSDRPYYTVPKQTHAFHITSIVQSVDGVPRMFLSYPILSDDGSDAFKGVVVASANLATVGQFLKSQLSSETPNTIGLMSTDGTILYSQDEKLIGLDYFGQEFQSKIPGDLKPNFNAAIKKSLVSSAMGQSELSYQGNSGTIVYEPVIVDGNTFAILYVVASHNFASETSQVLDNQRNFTLVFIVALAGVALAAAIVVGRWNKSLSAIVGSRTKELEFANESLKAKSTELQNALDTVEEANKRLEEANEQLRIHDRLQTEFINIAAHELRTPVQPLLGAAELLEQELEKGTENMQISRAEIEMIIRNAKRLARLSSDILEASRIESGSLRLQKERVNMNEKIKNVILDSRSFNDEKKIEIVFEPVSKEPVFVEADKSRMFEVLSNLIKNAIKFTNEGKIIVRLEQEDDYAVVKVIDTGRGIDPAIMPKLFTKFASKSDTGTGLGLFISKNIVEAHGGQIRANNNRDGKGATFAFSIPLAKSQEKQKAPEGGSRNE